MENETRYLPPEIITNILIRLPVKSLIQFRCVCKDWKNLFKTPSFIVEHLHHSTQQNPLLVADCDMPRCNNNPWHLTLLNNEMQVLEFQNQPIIDDSLTGSWMRIIHSNNGLLCVQFRTDDFHVWLWNPAIREVQKVPESLNNYNSDDFCVGFGFNPIVNDYKIVKLFMLHCSVVQVEVYALRTRLWRKVEFGNLEGVTIMSDSGFTCNGSIFWIGFNGESDLDLIVSFDIAMEVLTLIPLPTKYSFLELCHNTLTMYDNKLSLLSPTFIGNHESSFIDLWVMEECTDGYKERWVWTKIYTSRPYPRWLSPMTIWRNEIVCRVDAMMHGREDELEIYEEEVLLCNLTTNEFNMFAFPAKCSFACRNLDYAESLVPVINIHIEEP